VKKYRLNAWERKGSDGEKISPGSIEKTNPDLKIRGEGRHKHGLVRGKELRKRGPLYSRLNVKGGCYRKQQRGDYKKKWIKGDPRKSPKKVIGYQKDRGNPTKGKKADAEESSKVDR